MLVALISAIYHKLCLCPLPSLHLAPYITNDVVIPRLLLCPGPHPGLCELGPGVDLLQPLSCIVGGTEDQRGKGLA